MMSFPVIPCIPNHCRRCGDVLEGTDAEPIRHQVWDLPPIEPIVTEYQQHRLHCACCGITTCGDESPTKQKNTKAWLWVAVAPMFAVFGIFPNRKLTSLKALIGNYQDILLNCDRAKMYFDCKRLQWCWAHLKRDIQKLRDSPDRQVKSLSQNPLGGVASAGKV